MNTHVRDNLLALKVGMIPGGSVQIIWYDSLSGDNPVVDGTTYSDWYLCDGGTYNTYVTPDFRNRFIIGAGDTYAQNASGGATTKDVSHTHAGGTLATGAGSAHSHSNPNTAASSESGIMYTEGGTAAAVLGAHTHTQGATGTEAAHTHGSFTGASASGGSATQDILPPYRAAGYFMYCPA